MNLKRYVRNIIRNDYNNTRLYGFHHIILLNAEDN